MSALTGRSRRARSLLDLHRHGLEEAIMSHVQNGMVRSGRRHEAHTNPASEQATTRESGRTG